MNRRQIGEAIRHFVPIETLVPDDAARWRPVIQDALLYIFLHLDEQRLQSKIAEQLLLPRSTAPETRLLRLISRMPGLQKVGQVLARNRHIPPRLRDALSQLENGMHDVMPSEIRAAVENRLGDRLGRHGVAIAPDILSEASVSAVMRFTWRAPAGRPEEGVFKVMKPHIPACFAEDMRLLRDLGEYLTRKNRKYGFAAGPVRETLEEVRLLLEHELDFERERRTLEDAREMYRSSFGIRVPRLIPELCGEGVTAMTAENGVKVTEAFRRSAVRREHIANQIVEAVIAAPFFSWADRPVFHGDPHAGNLLYDEPNRELVVLDWALAEPLNKESRRQLVLLAMMTILRNRHGVCDAIEALSLRDGGSDWQKTIRAHVDRLFDRGRDRGSPGVLDAMMLLDEIALEGVRFPAALFLFRKVLFTLDGVLHDVAGHRVAIDGVLIRDFLSRAAGSFGVFHAPLRSADFVTIQREALSYPFRRLAWR